MPEQIIGIMGAMPEEILGIVALLEGSTNFTTGSRTYYSGKLNGTKTVVVVSGWGKVASASTVSTLIIHFRITELIFTGVAGAISPELKIGDIVLAKRLMQHDMDARPFIPRYEIPLTGKTYFKTSEKQLIRGSDAIRTLLENRHLHAIIEEKDLSKFNILTPQLFVGDVASGDKFFSSQADKTELTKNLPQTLCVEMEGAAVAQVCYENDTPFTIIRTISDASNEHSVMIFRHLFKRWQVNIPSQSSGIFLI